MDGTDLTVVVVTRNRASLLTMLLAHLEQQSYPAARFEILLIDLASADATQEVSERYAAGAPVRIRPIRLASTNAAAARNTAVRAASGTWVLFLDDDLLAGPRLVESHLRAQERNGGACVVVGRIERHPQSVTGAFFREPELGRRRAYIRNQPLRFVDWRIWNLSLPRDRFLTAGGFDESSSLLGLGDVELAWRLEQDGMGGIYSDEACAYLWRPMTVEEQRRRYYAEGYTLPRVLEKTGSDIVRNRYPRTMGAGLPAPDRLLLPLYRRGCALLAGNTRLSTYMCRRLLVHSLREGYRDATRGLPPRISPE
jgi:glycosyltransferase involved in cell wall biosynthesis